MPVRFPRVSALAGAPLLVVATAMALLPAAASPPSAAARVCPPLPAGFSPEGRGPARFTMLIRINQQDNVTTYTNFNESKGGLGDRIRPQDIFVINTRFRSTNPDVPSGPAEAARLASRLRAVFPCNRILALNGLSSNPSAPGYMFALLNHPAVYALMIDFEPGDWNQARAENPSLPPWVAKYRKALKRIKLWTAIFSNSLASSPSGAGKRAGLVPVDYGPQPRPPKVAGKKIWNFGQIAQILDKRNARLGQKLGLQSVMTQDSCADLGSTGFGNRARALLDQYKFRFLVKKVKRVKNQNAGKKPGAKKKKRITVRKKLKRKGRPLRGNLAMQISFSKLPDPNGGRAVTKTSPPTAAACARAGLKQGGGAFFFFASDNSMRHLFAQPQIAALRPIR